MLIINKQFIDCLAAIQKLPNEALIKLQSDFFNNKNSLRIHPDTGEFLDSRAFLALENLLLALPESERAKIPPYKTTQDKLRILEFTWLWWQGVSQSNVEAVNKITSLYHQCSRAHDSCFATRTSVMVARNHPALVQLTLEKFGRLVAMGFSPLEKHSPLGYFNSILEASSNDPLWQEMFAVFIQAFKQNKIKLTKDNLIYLLITTLIANNLSIMHAILPLTITNNYQDRGLTIAVLAAIHDALKKKNFSHTQELITSWQPYFNYAHHAPDAIIRFIELGISYDNETLLEIGLAALKTRQRSIEIPPFLFAQAYGKKGPIFVAQLKAYYGNQQYLELQNANSTDTPLYTSPNKLEQAIGQGGYSKILSATISYNNLNLPVAVKKYKSKNFRAMQIREANMHQVLGNDCDNVIKFFGLCQMYPVNALVLERAFYGDLLEFRAYLRNPDDTLLHKITLDCAKGLAYCHSKHLVVNDLKPDNVMLKANTEGVITACIGDLGLSFVAELTNNNLYQCGTLEYFAPEKFSEVKLNLEDALKTDIWSFGAVLYYLVFVEVPWADEIQAPRNQSINDQMVIAALLQNGKTLAFPKDEPLDGIPSIASVMHACFFKNPKQRIDSNELVKKLEQKHHFKK